MTDAILKPIIERDDDRSRWQSASALAIIEQRIEANRHIPSPGQPVHLGGKSVWCDSILSEGRDGPGGHLMIHENWDGLLQRATSILSKLFGRRFDRNEHVTSRWPTRVVVRHK